MVQKAKRKRLTPYGKKYREETDTIRHREKRERPTQCGTERKEGEADTVWHREKGGRGRHSVAQRERRERPTQCGTEINVEDTAGPTGDGLTPRSLRSSRSSRVLW